MTSKIFASRPASRIYTHNACHIGQIIYVARMQGVWDPNKGVK